jgi:hypothetical protein
MDDRLTTISVEITLGWGALRRLMQKVAQSGLDLDDYVSDHFETVFGDEGLKNRPAAETVRDTVSEIVTSEGR